jgi:hypothetical protein
VGYLPTQINNAPVLDNSQYLKGHDLALGMRFTKLFYHHLYTQIELNASAGNLSYGPAAPLTAATSFVQVGDVRFGYFFLPQDKFALTPYAVLGYQYWQLDTGGVYFKGNIKNGYTRFYQNGFYGIGLLTQLAVNPRLVLNADLQIGKTINPWTRYNAPEIKAHHKNIIYQSAFTNPQIYYQVGAGLDYAVNNQFHANAGVQYNHQQVASAYSNPSNLVQPHLSIAQWNYHVGAGVNLDADTNSFVSGFVPTVDAIVAANNQADFWFGYVFQNYGETIPGSSYYFDREVENIPAVNMAITKTFQRIYSQFNLLFAGGNTQYKSTAGGAPDPSAPSNDVDRNTLFVSGLRLGYMFFPSSSVGLTPYIAGGYRRWLRDISGIPNEKGYLLNGYPETYQFAWYSLGMLVQYSPSPNWVFNIDGNAGTMENVTNKSWTPLLAPATYQALLTLKQRFIYNIGVGGDYRFAKDWHLLLQLNYVYFNFGRSANKYLPEESYWYEPNSTTRQFSMMAGIGYQLA